MNLGVAPQSDKGYRLSIVGSFGALPRTLQPMIQCVQFFQAAANCRRWWQSLRWSETGHGPCHRQFNSLLVLAAPRPNWFVLPSFPMGRTSRHVGCLSPWASFAINDFRRMAFVM